MIRLDVGQSYHADRVRSGNSSKGPWELIVVQDGFGRNHKEITIWATNVPCGVIEGNMFEIKEIESMTWGARKDQNGKWKDQVSMNGKVIPINPPTFDELAGGMDDLPFDMSDDPFASSGSPFDELEQLPL